VSTDRLRQAATELDAWAGEDDPEGRNAAHWRAEAALLRAVADEDDRDVDSLGFPMWPAVLVAALALADTILGAES